MMAKPKTNSSRCFLAASLLVFGTSSCAGNLEVSEDPAAEDGGGGDGGGGTGSGGSGGESATADNSGSGDSGSGDPGTSATGGSSSSAGGVSTTHCFVPPPGVDAESVCAPTCEVQPAELRGTPCPHSITGGEGICAPFLDYLPSHNAYTPAGVCSISCDPLAPDCPENFACGLTEGGGGDPIPLIFACLPSFGSSAVGTECDGWPTGLCAPGSECIQAVEGFTCDDPNMVCDPSMGVGYTCRAYCDTGEDDACPESQTCEKPEWFPEASPVGVCLD